jgi:hypothetical protein
MIAIIRIVDLEVMPSRQGSDFQKKEHLAKKKATVGTILDPRHREREFRAIKTLEAERQKYYQNRLNGAVKSFGGSHEDYEIVDVPKKEKLAFMKANYIEFDGTTFTYYLGPRYVIDGTKVTVSAPQWVRGTDVLSEPDETDFSSLTEDTNFAIEIWQDKVSQQLSVEIFLWGSLEDQGQGPEGKEKRKTMCRGIYHADTKKIEVI